MRHSTILFEAVWRKSSYSQGMSDDCVELARIGEAVAIRDSKDPGGPCLVFGMSDLRGFVERLRSGSV
jgi:hypothetical protein